MNTIHLSDRELQTTRQGMTAFLMGFGHDQADIHKDIRSVLAKLAAAETEPEVPEVAVS